MKKNTLRTLGIMVLSTVLVASTVTGCGNNATTDAPATEVVEAVVETEAAPEATEEVVVESTETLETEEVEVTEEVEETEVVEEEPEFTVTDMSAIKYAKTAANVRAGASKDYEVIGSLKLNQQVTVTGQADTGWYRIDYNGKEAYVSNSLLVDQKVVVSTPTATTTQPTTDTTQTQTPVVDNSAWTDGATAVTPSTPAQTPSTPAVTPSAPVVDDSNSLGTIGGLGTGSGPVTNPDVNNETTWE